MQILHPTLEHAPSLGPSVVALGVFDGVHAGHREILRTVVAHARSRDLASTVVTFDPHPSVLLAPEQRPRLLMTLPQRLAAFEEAGLDQAWVIPFSRAFSELSAQAFLEAFQRVLAPTELHVGSGFHFGHQRGGRLETLQAWGRETGCEIQAYSLRAPDGGPLSSTRIREALDRGDAEAASQLLGRPFALTGIVVEGDRRGRHLGYPTANLAWEQEQLPAFGAYVTEVRGSHLQGTRLGLTNVGEKPTFHGLALTVESYLPDFQGDLYGSRLEVGFLHRLRPEQRFADLEALRVQIGVDVEQGKTWWAEHHP